MIEFIESGIAVTQTNLDCQALIADAENNTEWKPSIPNWSGYRANLILAGNKLPKWDAALFPHFASALGEYQKDNPRCLADTDEGYSILKHEPGQCQEPGVDSRADQWTIARQLSAILFLNDDFDGGKLKFERQNLTVKAQAGKIVLFPSNYNYIYEITSVLSGIRYSVVTWFGVKQR